MADPPRPPSVDALARVMAASGLPHAVCVVIARELIAEGPAAYEGAAALSRATSFAHALLGPVINATGVLLHTNLGRAPMGVAHPPSAMNLELDLDTGGRGSRQRVVGGLLAMLCGSEAAMVVNNNAAAVLLVLAAIARDKQVLVSRGESVEIGGGFRIPDVMEQSGAHLVDVGTTNRTRVADYRKAMNRKDADVGAILKVHPSNYRVEGFVEGTAVAELGALGVPVIADIGSGLIDVNCPWLAGPPPVWLQGEPAAKQTLADGAALVTFSGDKLFGGPQAGVIAGRAELVDRCARHPLARALRPGGHVMLAMQRTALAYLDKTAATRVPLWAMVVATTDELHARADEIVTAAGVGEIQPTEAVPGAGSAPGATIPSVGIRIDGDRLALLRSCEPPVVARTRDGSTWVDLRTVDPGSDSGAGSGVAAMRVVATAGHVDHGKSALVEALTGTNPDRFEEERRRGLTIDLGFAHATLPSGEGISFIDVPGHVRFLRNMLAGVGAVDACMFVVAATEGWKPQSEEHLRILELLGLSHGIVTLTKIDLVDDEWRQLQELEVRDRLGGSFLAEAPIVPVSSTTGSGLDDVRGALGELVHRTPAAPDRGRPRLWVDRVFAAKGSGTVVTGTLTGGALRADQQLHAAGHAVRIRAIQSHGERHESIAPGHRVALNLVGVEHTDLRRGDAVIVPAQWRPTRRFDASLRVLPALHHEVSRRGAYFVYIGSGEFEALVRVLGDEAIRPGGDGLVRLHLAQALPLAPGDRFVLRESGRDETVGGGEVLDVAPVLRASRARPDRSIDRVIAERGWVTVDDLEALTGERRQAMVGHWVVAPAALQATTVEVRGRIEAAGDMGLDIAELDEHQRAVVTILDGVTLDGARARLADAHDPLHDHPFVAALLAGGVAPPPASGVDKVQLRELLRRQLVVERDGVYFHPSTIDAVAQAAARLLRLHPDGFTVAQLRDDLGVSRKYALPLVNELDARGITRRRGDLRVAGPRLPGAAESAHA